MNKLRIAWLLPTAWFYWHPVLCRFTQLFPQTTVFTGLFPGFAQGFEDTFPVKVVGEMKYIETAQKSSGYGSGFTYLSPKIIAHLLEFQPHLIFADSFRIWTLFALLLKPLCKWRVILTYEGSSPGVDYQNSALRLFLRRTMVRGADVCITNSSAGKAYLINILGAEENRVFAMPYEVPDAKALLGSAKDREAKTIELQQPVFLFVGHLVPRKGLYYLLQGCLLLKQQGYSNYTLLIIGDGSERDELEAFSKNYDLSEQVKWLGRMDYDQLGACFSKADVFVLPTLEDTWGMVVLEAMLFSKPILCSKWAGSAEMIINGENGYVFDPYQPLELAERMEWFINNFGSLNSMGEKSKQLIEKHTPELVVESLAKIVEIAISL